MRDKLERILIVLFSTAIKKGFRFYYQDLQGVQIPLRDAKAAAEWIMEAQTDKSWKELA